MEIPRHQSCRSCHKNRHRPLHMAPRSLAAQQGFKCYATSEGSSPLPDFPKRNAIVMHPHLLRSSVFFFSFACRNQTTVQEIKQQLDLKRHDFSRKCLGASMTNSEAAAERIGSTDVEPNHYRCSRNEELGHRSDAR